MIRASLARDDVQLWLERGVVAALVGYFIAVGFAGIDFGRHWDEVYQLEGLKQCASTLTWFPQRQIYNGLYFVMGLPFVLVKAAPFLPDIFTGVAHNSTYKIDLSSYESVRNAQAAIVAYLDSPDYLLAVRRAFVCVTSLAIVWVYLTVRALKPRPRPAALAAAAFVALSWELGYHARFVAVDGIVMQFVALQIYAFVRSYRAAEPGLAARWAALTAAAAAAAWAGKTPAALTLLPALVLVLRPGLPSDERRWIATIMAGSYLVVAFMLSPSAFIDPLRYVGDMAFARHNYNAVGVSDPQYLPSWLSRVGRSSIWLFAAAPSPFVGCAAVMSGLALYGWWSRVEWDPVTAIWTVFSALYLALMSLNQILIVRNCLLVVPFVATMFGLGVARLYEETWPRWVKLTGTAVIATTFCLNIAWGIRAAASIRTATPDRVLEQFRSDMDAAGSSFRLSPGLVEKLGREWTTRMHCRPLPTDAAAGSTSAGGATSRIYLFHREHSWNRWTNNQLGVLDAFYGPLDSNTDWYITFPGKMPGERIVGLSAARAKAALLDLSQYQECKR